MIESETRLKLERPKTGNRDSRLEVPSSGGGEGEAEARTKRERERRRRGAMERDRLLSF